MNHQSWAWLPMLSLTLCLLSTAYADDPLPALDLSPAPLIYHDRTITVFRAPFLGLTPKERVAASSRRLTRLLEQHRGEPIKTTSEPNGIVVWVGKTALFAITPGDLDTASQQTMESVAAEAVRQLDYREPDTWSGRAMLWVAPIKPWLWPSALVIATFLALRGISHRLLRVSCPECHTNDRAQVAVSRRWSKSSWFKLRSTYHCRACGHEWGSSSRRRISARHNRPLKS